MATSLIVDKADRIATINQEVNRSTRTERRTFRGEMTDLPVVRLEVGLPVYRINNGRTSVAQLSYVEANDCDEGFFDGSEEDASVQDAQDIILRELAKDSRASIYNELAQVAIQTEPLLLTSHGSVLNGNRRLAAMRELFNENPAKYSRYSHVDAAILPKNAVEKDLELLETELQLTPKTHLEYGWIERRLKLRRQVRELKIDRGRIKTAYRFRKDQDINVELSQLDLAEEYLSEYLKKPHAYEIVAKSELLFKDLEKSLRGSRATESESRRNLGFLLAKEAQNLGDRVYGFKSIFGKDFATFAEKFANRHGITLATIDQSAPQTSDPADPLSGLPVSTLSGANIDYTEIATKLGQQPSTQQLGEQIVDIAEEIKGERRDQSSGEAALRGAERVNSLLQEIDLSTAETSTLPGIAAQLASAIAHATTLKDEVQHIISESTESIQ